MGEALALLAGGDPELFRIIGRTLAISGAATVLAMLAGVPLGYALARGRFPGRTVLLGAVNTGMGMPPVVVGLVVWLLLTRSGPLGDWGLIYTRQAMVIAQFVIATPLVVGFTAASIQALPARQTCGRAGRAAARRSEARKDRQWRAWPAPQELPAPSSQASGSSRAMRR
jgi:tungstate transport system permease protein